MYQSFCFHEDVPAPLHEVDVVGFESGLARRMRPAVEYAVANVFGVGVAELRMANRGRAKIALARQAAMYLVHVNLGLSLTETGELFDRDRTTVAHGCHRIENLRDDPVFDRVLGLLERALRFMFLASEQREALD